MPPRVPILSREYPPIVEGRLREFVPNHVPRPDCADVARQTLAVYEGLARPAVVRR